MDQISKICKNAWCKAQFFFTESDMIESDEITENGEVLKIEPSFCPKCISFNYELSNGVSWEERQYEDDPFSNGPFPIKYRVTNYKS